MQSAPTWAPTMFMYAAFAAIFYFILFRPQQQQRKRHEALIQQLKKGDEVITGGGVVGQVMHIQEQAAGKPGMEDRVTIKSGESRLVVERRSITRVGAVSAPQSPAAAPPVS
jgi:preprotein translocase subunit YajC